MRIADAAHGPAGQLDERPHLDSPMPGTVVMVRVEDGAHVDAGDAVVVVEAMKMEHVVRATIAGTVALHAAAGDLVSRGQVLATVTPNAAEAGPVRGAEIADVAASAAADEPLERP